MTQGLVAQGWWHRNTRMLAKLLVLAALMFGFGYAMVPLYRSICSALGINVLAAAEQEEQAGNTQIDTTRLVTVELDANARGLWEFHPEQASVRVHPGQLTTVMYDFRNAQERTLTAQAIPSYAPKNAAEHFHKLECFCFQQHTLRPGESKRWPVVFVVDPKLPHAIGTITLSYTFFEVGSGVPTPPDDARAAKERG